MGALRPHMMMPYTRPTLMSRLCPDEMSRFKPNRTHGVETTIVSWRSILVNLGGSILETVWVRMIVHTLSDLTSLITRDKYFCFILRFRVFQNRFQVPLAHCCHVGRKSHGVVVVVVVVCWFCTGAVATTVCTVWRNSVMGGGGRSEDGSSTTD